MLLSVTYDFVTGTINLKGSVFELDADLPIFIGFGLFKIVSAVCLVIYYRKIAKESAD